jgi:1,4-alpha-glucan branching enzyme
MGEDQASLSPFLFFTDHNPELAQAVREGRRREFAGFAQFSDPQQLKQIPDPNARATFERSKPEAHSADTERRESLYRQLLSIRRSEIVPRLDGARALNASAVGPAAVLARWRMGDGAILVLASNLAAEAVAIPPQPHRLLFSSSEAAANALATGRLAPYSTIALLSS